MRANEKITVKTISMTGLMMALIFVTTYFATIPIPLGYANLGSTTILIGAFLLGWKPGIIAGAIGPALSDFMMGYAEWIVPTLIVKGIMVIIYLIIAGNNNYSVKFRVIFGAIAANLWAAIGYTIGGAILYGSWAAGLSSTPGLLMESAINTIIFLIVIHMLAKSNALKRLK